MKKKSDLCIIKKSKNHLTPKGTKNFKNYEFQRQLFGSRFQLLFR